MKSIKENFEANLYDGSSPVKDDNVEAVTSIAHKAALEDSKKKYQAIKKDFKKQSDDLKDFIKSNHDRKNEGDKKAMRKLVLDESLFEHFNDDPNTYEDIFRILENIEFVAHESMEMDDEEMTPKMMRQTYDVLEDSLKELQERVEELEARDDVDEACKRPKKSAKKTNLKEAKEEKDLWELVYDELCGDIRAQDAPDRRFKVNKSARYSDGDMSFSGNKIMIHKDTEKELEFANKVANEYKVDIVIKENKGRFAPAKYSAILTIPM